MFLIIFSHYNLSVPNKANSAAHSGEKFVCACTVSQGETAAPRGRAAVDTERSERVNRNPERLAEPVTHEALQVYHVITQDLYNRSKHHTSVTRKTAGPRSQAAARTGWPAARRGRSAGCAARARASPRGAGPGSCRGSPRAAPARAPSRGRAAAAT